MNHMKYSYLLFDWDGCLAKTLEVWLNAYKMALKNRGVSAEDQEITHHFGDWDLGKHFGVKDFVEFNQEAVAYSREQLKTVELYEGAKEVVAELHKTYKLALLSSASKDILLNGIRHNKLDTYFDLIISGDDVDNHKPHPEVINKALAHFEAKRGEVIMIGDSRKDLGAAHNAGVDSILVYPDDHKIFYNLEELKSLHPTFIVKSLSDIQRTIKAD